MKIAMSNSVDDLDSYFLDVLRGWYPSHSIVYEDFVIFLILARF